MALESNAQTCTTSIDSRAGHVRSLNSLSDVRNTRIDTRPTHTIKTEPFLFLQFPRACSIKIQFHSSFFKNLDSFKKVDSSNEQSSANDCTVQGYTCYVHEIDQEFVHLFKIFPRELIALKETKVPFAKF